MTKTISTLASEALAFFSQDKRTDGNTFWKHENAPEWVKELCHEAHRYGSGAWDCMLPDDFRYEFIVEALSALSEHEDADEACDSLEPDIYTNDLNRWLSSNLNRSGYVDEAVEEFGGHSDQGVTGDIALGQLQEKREVFFKVRSALEDRLSEIEDEESEEPEDEEE